MTFNVLLPTLITADAQLISSSATESADTTWVAWTAGSQTFTLGDTYKYAHVRYEVLQTYTRTSVATDHVPGVVGSEDWWLALEATEQWAMFDTRSTTATHDIGSLVVEVRPGAVFSSGSVTGVTGAGSVLWETFSGAGRTGADLVWSETKTLDATYVGDWYSYWFDPFDVYTDLLFGGIDGTTGSGSMPPYRNGEVRLTVTGTTGSTEVGVAGFLVGLSVPLGEVLNGASGGIIDFSVNETDGYGERTLVVRGFAKQNSLSFKVPKAQFRRVASTLSQLRAIPAVYVPSPDIDLSPLITFGPVQEWSYTVAYRDHIIFTIEINGL